MKATIARWIRATFAMAPDVKSASTEPDPSIIFKPHQADVVVSTWMGSRIYVYLLTQEPRVRDIKNILRDNSRSGIGTLFLLNKSLLPQDQSHVKLQDWYQALMLLNDEFIYVYYIADDAVQITQAHFTPLNPKNEFLIWYLPDFEIKKVTVKRRDVTAGNIKGNWHIGDIASPDYKRRVGDERASQRFHYRTKYTQDIPHNGAGRSRASAATNGRDLRLEQYYNLIGVEKGASEKEIKAAFRQMALRVHPDVSALPRQEANERIKQLNEAYEYIKSYHGWT